MKKIFTLAAAFLIAAMSLGSTTAFAAEVPEFSRPSERPAFLENAEIREKPELTDEEKAAMLENARASLDEKLTAGEITQEQYDEIIAKIESGSFAFRGKGFKGGRGFKDMDGEKPEWAELTEEEKAAMLENIKSSIGDNFQNGRLERLKNAVPGRKLASTEEQ